VSPYYWLESENEGARGNDKRQRSSESYACAFDRVVMCHLTGKSAQGLHRLFRTTASSESEFHH